MNVKYDIQITSSCLAMLSNTMLQRLQTTIDLNQLITDYVKVVYHNAGANTFNHRSAPLSGSLHKWREKADSIISWANPNQEI